MIESAFDSLTSREVHVKIRFKITIDDMIALQCFHLTNSPTWRGQLLRQVLLVPASFGVLFLLAWLASQPIADGDPTFLIFGLVLLAASIAWIFFIPWRMKRMQEGVLRKFFAEGSNRSVLGWREMELVENRLVIHTELIHSTIDLRAIEKIVGNDHYTFVYIASMQAYVIPMNLYPEDEYRDFVAELREAWDNRGLAIPREKAEPPARPAEERVMKRRDY
jgi:hypothetical protein